MKQAAHSKLALFAAEAEPRPQQPFLITAKTMRLLLAVPVLLAVAMVAGILVWQGLTAAGNPDPTLPKTSPTVAIMDVGVLVFREGLECVLVLAAITASLTGARRTHQRPVAFGAAIGLAATLATWFISIGVLRDLMESVSALNLQAATGLLAVVVLLVVMNWYFHKIYWGGWISMHNRKKKELINSAGESEISHSRLLFGLGLLGFASVYREGFEVVLFLQSYYLKMGGQIVFYGAALGLFLSAIIAVMTFVAHRRLPYRKMLVFTGVMLGFVLLVMVGEQAQEMQLAHWIPTTQIPILANHVPGWMGLWFSIFPTVQTLVAQGLAALVVVGSYFLARSKSAAA